MDAIKSQKKTLQSTLEVIFLIKKDTLGELGTRQQDWEHVNKIAGWKNVLQFLWILDK